MIPLLVAQPSTHEAEIKRPPPKRVVREPTLPPTSRFEDPLSGDEKYIVKLLAWFFVLLVLPALLTLIFIALSPDAFMYDVTPQGDFSTWQPGQRP